MCIFTLRGMMHMCTHHLVLEKHLFSLNTRELIFHYCIYSAMRCSSVCQSWKVRKIFHCKKQKALDRKKMSVILLQEIHTITNPLLIQRQTLMRSVYPSTVFQTSFLIPPPPLFLTTSRADIRAAGWPIDKDWRVLLQVSDCYQFQSFNSVTHSEA